MTTARKRVSDGWDRCQHRKGKDKLCNSHEDHATRHYCQLDNKPLLITNLAHIGKRRAGEGMYVRERKNEKEEADSVNRLLPKGTGFHTFMIGLNPGPGARRTEKQMAQEGVARPLNQARAMSLVPQ